MGPGSEHSYDPGTSRNGVFWTTAVPWDSVEFDFEEGKAQLRLRNIPVFDVFIVPNSLDGDRPRGAPVSARIDTLDLRWSGVTRTTSFTSTDPRDMFAGTFKETGAHITVTATTPRATGHGFRFVSDPNTGATEYAQIGIHRSGRLR